MECVLWAQDLGSITDSYNTHDNTIIFMNCPFYNIQQKSSALSPSPWYHLFASLHILQAPYQGNSDPSIELMNRPEVASLVAPSIFPVVSIAHSTVLRRQYSPRQSSYSYFLPGYSALLPIPSSGPPCCPFRSERVCLIS